MPRRRLRDVDAMSRGPLIGNTDWLFFVVSFPPSQPAMVTDYDLPFIQTACRDIALQIRGSLLEGWAQNFSCLRVFNMSP